MKVSKAVILAGGLGTRISEETELKPKPMVEIGGKPILWHLMKIYSHHGINDFVVCCGYKGYVIKFCSYPKYQFPMNFKGFQHRANASWNVYPKDCSSPGEYPGEYPGES